MTYPGHSIGDRTESHTGNMEGKVHRINQRDRGTYNKIPRWVGSTRSKGGMIWRYLPKECPTIVTFFAPWAEIAVLTAASTWVAVLWIHVKSTRQDMDSSGPTSLVHHQIHHEHRHPKKFLGIMLRPDVFWWCWHQLRELDYDMPVSMCTLRITSWEIYILDVSVPWWATMTVCWDGEYPTYPLFWVSTCVIQNSRRLTELNRGTITPRCNRDEIRIRVTIGYHHIRRIRQRLGKPKAHSRKSKSSSLMDYSKP